MVDMAHIAGLVAAGVHPSPIPYAERIPLVTNGDCGSLGIVFLLQVIFAASKTFSASFPGH